MTTSVSSSNDILNSLIYPEQKNSAIYNQNIDEIIRLSKINAIKSNDQLEASRIWQAQTILEIQRDFLEAFELLKISKFYNAWCKLEQCEIKLSNLKYHHSPSSDDFHRINYIERMTARWQNIYPYKVFFSPELLKKKVLCSICGLTITPRTRCGHLKREIYDGNLCHHIVVDVEILSISIVENPVQKYSVAFYSEEKNSESKDHYDYGNIRFIVDRLDSPFDEWESEFTTKILKHSELSHLDKVTNCPCLSGKNFGECCYGKSKITVPHLQVNFYVQSSKALPEIEYLF